MRSLLWVLVCCTYLLTCHRSSLLSLSPFAAHTMAANAHLNCSACKTGCCLEVVPMPVSLSTRWYFPCLDLAGRVSTARCWLVNGVTHSMSSRTSDRSSWQSNCLPSRPGIPPTGMLCAWLASHLSNRSSSFPIGFLLLCCRSYCHLLCDYSPPVWAVLASVPLQGFAEASACRMAWTKQSNYFRRAPTLWEHPAHPDPKLGRLVNQRAVVRDLEKLGRLASRFWGIRPDALQVCQAASYAFATVQLGYCPLLPQPAHLLDFSECWLHVRAKAGSQTSGYLDSSWVTKSRSLMNFNFGRFVVLTPLLWASSSENHAVVFSSWETFQAL